MSTLPTGRRAKGWTLHRRGADRLLGRILPGRHIDPEAWDLAVLYGWAK